MVLHTCEPDFRYRVLFYNVSLIPLSPFEAMHPMPKQRTPRTDAVLVKMSDPLHYEMGMLDHTAKWLSDWKGDENATEEEKLYRNAIIESFVIHARSLVAFFYAERPHPDEAIAADYLPTWPTDRPAISPELTALHPRVGTEIAHLDYGRLSILEEARGWQFGVIVIALMNTAVAFVRLVPDDKLCDKMLDFKRHFCNGP